MNDNWEKLKGKTYPDTLDEQLKALHFGGVYDWSTKYGNGGTYYAIRRQ